MSRRQAKSYDTECAQCNISTNLDVSISNAVPCFDVKFADTGTSPKSTFRILSLFALEYGVVPD